MMLLPTTLVDLIEIPPVLLLLFVDLLEEEEEEGLMMLMAFGPEIIPISIFFMYNMPKGCKKEKKEKRMEK